MKKLVFFAISIAFLYGICSGQEKSSSIDGVWKIVEYSYSSPDTSYINSSPQPGLFIFLKEYYSMMYITGNKPRTLMGEDETRYTINDKQMRSIFMNFVGNSGKFKLDGSKLKTSGMVALWPNFMTGGGWELDCKIDGNNMLWHRTAGEDIKVRYKLSRIE